jgi:hypothetical protein
MLASASGYPVVVRLFALLAVCLPVFCSSINISNVNVVDVETGSVRKGVNVVVSRGYITLVGATPKPKVSVDGTGKYLIPGLWDMHVHLWDQQSLFGMYVANGVLGVRDMGSNLARTKEWRSTIEAARRIGPRIYTSGSPVDGPGYDGVKMTVVRAGSPDAARRAVDAIDSQGGDFVTVLSSLSRDSYTALAQRARVIRAVFAGHVPESVTVSQALDARQKSMEHLFGIALACSSEEAELREARLLAIDAKDYAALAQIRQRTYDTFSEPKAAELFRRMARFDVWQTPTLTVRKRLALIGIDELTGNPLAAKVPAEIRSTWQDPREDLKKATEDQMARFKRDYQFHQRLVAAMQRNGVGLLAGTDTGEPYVLPGYSLHNELESFVDAGLTPAQALRTATINPARYFGIETRAGSIAPGKRADLVLLDGNPLDDIRNTRKISGVVVRGRLLDRKELDRVLKETDATWKGNTPFLETPPDTRPVKRLRASRKRGSRSR